MDKFVCRVCISIVVVIQICSSTLPLAKHKTGTKCYGDYDVSYTVLSLSCPENSVIAVTRIQVGAKKRSSNCPENFDKNKHNSSCCEQSEDDCIFDFDTSFNHLYHINCNGQRSCRMQAQHTLTYSKCSSVHEYLDTTSYMYVEYSCIPETNICKFCSADETVYDSVLYLWNSELPGEMTGGAGTECGCSVEIDNCEAEIHVYSIQRNLTKESEWTACDPEQTLTIRDSNTKRVLDWTCHDNTLYTRSNIVTSTYLTVNLDNKRRGNGGNFWLAFQASKSANIAVHCPSRRQQFCLDTTTATSIPSATTILKKTTGSSTTTSTSTTPLSIVNSTKTTISRSSTTTSTSTTPLSIVNSTKTTTSRSSANTINTTDPAADLTSAPTSERTVEATPLVTTEAPTTNLTYTSTPTGPKDVFDQWVAVGTSTGGGLVIVVIVIALIFKRRCRIIRKDEREPIHSEAEESIPYAYPYGTHNPGLEINAADDARISTSTYITPIHDSDYTSVRSTNAHRMNETVQNEEQNQETHHHRIQPCHGLAPIRNNTYP